MRRPVPVSGADQEKSAMAVGNRRSLPLAGCGGHHGVPRCRRRGGAHRLDCQPRPEMPPGHWQGELTSQGFRKEIAAARSLCMCIVAAGGGTVAPGMPEQWVPQLVLMNIKLPDANGLDLTRRLRRGTVALPSSSSPISPNTVTPSCNPPLTVMASCRPGI